MIIAIIVPEAVGSTEWLSKKRYCHRKPIGMCMEKATCRVTAPCLFLSTTLYFKLPLTELYSSVTNDRTTCTPPTFPFSDRSCLEKFAMELPRFTEYFRLYTKRFRTCVSRRSENREVNDFWRVGPLCWQRVGKLIYRLVRSFV